MEGNNEYLALLHEYGFTEDDVSPMVADNRKDAAHALILRVLASKDAFEEFERKAPGALQKLIESLKRNTNALAEKLNVDFLKKIHDLGIRVPEGVHVGVFPTRYFNAHAVKRPGGYLVMLDDGLFAVIEAATTLMVAGPRFESSAEHLSQIIRQYCIDHTLPDPKKYEVGETFEKYVVATASVNFAEEFVIAHEYGHLARGHLSSDGRTMLQAHGGDFPVISKSIREEHEADHWAFHVIAHNHLRGVENELERLSCLGGPFVFLGVATLIEEFLGRNKQGAYMQQDKTHPPAVERLVRAWLYFGMMDISNEIDFGKRFLELVDNCFQILFGERLKIDDNLMSRVAMNLPFRLSEQMEKMLKNGRQEAEFELLNSFVEEAYRTRVLAPATGISATDEPGPAIGVWGTGVFQSAPGEDRLLDLFEDTCTTIDNRNT